MITTLQNRSFFSDGCARLAGDGSNTNSKWVWIRKKKYPFAWKIGGSNREKEMST